MAFNKKKFMQAKFVPRTGQVAVSAEALTVFFDEGDEKVFKVRGLTASEIAMTNEAITRNLDKAALIDAAASNASNKKKVENIKKAFGLSGDTPADTAKRIETIRLGATEPPLEEDEVVKIGEVSPAEFNMIAGEIMKLTVMGAEAKVKPKPSGTKQMSETA